MRYTKSITSAPGCGSGSTPNFDTDPDPGKKGTNPDLGKKAVFRIRMDPGFVADPDPDPDSEKKTYTDPDPGKNADPKHYKKDSVPVPGKS